MATRFLKRLKQSKQFTHHCFTFIIAALVYHCSYLSQKYIVPKSVGTNHEWGYKIGREDPIRTDGWLITTAEFQAQCNRPLCHFSNNQDTITCSMSKIGIEPIITIFRIAACVFRNFYTVVGNESAIALITSQLSSWLLRTNSCDLVLLLHLSSKWPHSAIQKNGRRWGNRNPLCCL